MTAPLPSPEWPQMSEHFSSPEAVNATDDDTSVVVPYVELIREQLNEALMVFGYDFIDNLRDIEQTDDTLSSDKEVAIIAEITRLKEELSQIYITGPVAVRTIAKTNNLVFIDNPAAVGALRILRGDHPELVESEEQKTVLRALRRSFKRSLVSPAKVLEPLEKLRTTYFSDDTTAGLVVPRDCSPLSRFVAPLSSEEQDMLISAGMSGFMRQRDRFFGGFVRYDSNEFLAILRQSQSPSDTWQHVLKPYLKENAVLIDELRNCTDDSYETLTAQVKAGLVNLAQSLIAEWDYR